MAFKLDPSTTALIAIDMQRDFCCEDGYVSRQPRSPPRAGTRHCAVSLLSARVPLLRLAGWGSR